MERTERSFPKLVLGDCELECGRGSVSAAVVCVQAVGLVSSNAIACQMSAARLAPLCHDAWTLGAVESGPVQQLSRQTSRALNADPDIDVSDQLVELTTGHSANIVRALLLAGFFAFEPLH